MHPKIILFNIDPTKKDIILSQRPPNLCQQVQRGVGVLYQGLHKSRLKPLVKGIYRMYLYINFLLLETK